jgi:hypothetical protein
VGVGTFSDAFYAQVLAYGVGLGDLLADPTRLESHHQKVLVRRYTIYHIVYCGCNSNSNNNNINIVGGGGIVASRRIVVVACVLWFCCDWAWRRGVP